MRRSISLFCLSFTLCAASFTVLHAQAPAAPARPGPTVPAAQPPAPTQAVTPPADYVIGPDDVLSVVFWREDDLTADVIVRPDGKITLPLINDIQAAGLTPEQLRASVAKAASPFIDAPTVMVRIKEIKSRFVTIVGEVQNQGPVALGAPMTVLQLIGRAGGLTEFANKKNIMVIRNENGREGTFKFNYNDVSRGENLKQNIELKPGDTVVVP